LDTLEGSSGSYQDANQNAFNAIHNAQSNIVTSARSIDSLFSRLPSTHELDELILAADSIAILKTVQTLASDDSIPCSYIVDYLLEMLGRIRAAIEMKQFAIDQLIIIIEGAEAEIKRLQGEISRLEDEKKALWLEEIRDNLAKLAKELEQCYQEFNAIEAQIAPNEARVAGFEKEIEILMNSSDEERNRLASDRLRLTEVEALIRDLENQLNAARNRRESILASIARSQEIIAENEKKIAEARSKIEALEKEIEALRDKSDSIRRKCTDLEIQVERLRTDKKIAEAKEDRLNDQIEALEQRIAIEEEKLAYDELHTLEDMVETLQNLLPGIEREVDRQYYYCYGEGSVTVETTGSVVVYIVRGESFGNYLLSVYGQSVKVPAVRARDYHLYKVDIFSPAFTSKFGAPYAVGEAGNGLQLSGDFSCLREADAFGSGTIDSINGNEMVISNHLSRENVRVGACTRFEATSSTPSVGMKVAFRGAASAADGYNFVNAHSVTCW
jgi:archaellum component FlaC